MEAFASPPELAAQLDDEMRAQERQLVVVRLAVVALAIGFLLFFGDPIANRVALLGLLVGVVAYSVLIGIAVGTVRVRPVAVVGVVLDAAAVTAVVWLASNVPDSYLFYSLVILGAAVRFGMVPSVAASIAISGAYVGVILAGTEPGSAIRELLPVRVLFLVTFGVVAGLFSSIILGRAAENSRLQRQVQAQEHERELARQRDLLARLGRDFAASFDRKATRRAVVAGSAPLLGDATMLLMAAGDDRLAPAAAEGRNSALAARWRALTGGRHPRVGEGTIGAAAADRASRLGRAVRDGHDDPDRLRELNASWLLAVPILVGGRLIGVLATVGERGREPDDAIWRMAEAVADRAGPALQNADLWSDLQERVAREQEARRVKDDFLSVVSHELRTPLTSIQGYSQLLEVRLRESRSSKELRHVRVILSQVMRMRRLVDDLLDVNRMDRIGGVSIEPVDFDLAELLRDAVSRFSRAEPERDIALTAPETLAVHLDRERIDQVLSNLLENAVKYSPDGGPIRVVAAEHRHEVEIAVSDCGMGIPAAHREHVFERFYQADDGQGRRRFGGLGLGLAISRAITEAHGGRIWAAANEEAGRGSVISFRVPRTAKPRDASHVGDGEEPPQFLRRRGDS